MLVQRGYRIVAFGRDLEKGRRLVNEYTEFYQGSIEDLNRLRTAFKGCDMVLHSAALSSLWGPWEDFYQTNVVGIKHVLRVSKEAKVKKLVYISSPSVYCRPEDQFDISEDQHYEGEALNHYIRSKRMAEREVLGFCDAGFERIILRPRALFGIGDTSIIPRLLRANNRLGIPLFKKGRNLIDITYVENVAHAVCLALEREGREGDSLDGEIFNITNGEPLPFREILAMFLEEIGEKPRFLKLPLWIVFPLVSIVEKIYSYFKLRGEPTLTRYSIITLAYSQTMDISKAEKRLGYKPLKTIREGIRIYGTWYKKCHNQD